MPRPERGNEGYRDGAQAGTRLNFGPLWQMPLCMGCGELPRVLYRIRKRRILLRQPAHHVKRSLVQGPLLFEQCFTLLEALFEHGTQPCSTFIEELVRWFSSYQ